MNQNPKPFWPNPWDDVVYVPIEELVECHAGIGQSCGIPDGSSVIMTQELILENWKSYGPKLDAYILPQPSGWHDIGVRYGAEGSQYLSPMGDKKKVAALLSKWR